MGLAWRPCQCSPRRRRLRAPRGRAAGSPGGDRWPAGRVSRRRSGAPSERARREPHPQVHLALVVGRRQQPRASPPGTTAPPPAGPRPAASAPAWMRTLYRVPGRPGPRTAAPRGVRAQPAARRGPPAPPGAPRRPPIPIPRQVGVDSTPRSHERMPEHGSSRGTWVGRTRSTARRSSSASRPSACESSATAAATSRLERLAGHGRRIQQRPRPWRQGLELLGQRRGHGRGHARLRSPFDAGPARACPPRSRARAARGRTGFRRRAGRCRASERGPASPSSSCASAWLSCCSSILLSDGTAAQPIAARAPGRAGRRRP